jgi:hypothetical protein
MIRLLIAAVVFSAGVAAGSSPPRDYPFRVRAIRVVQDPQVIPPGGGRFVQGPDIPTGRGSAAIFDESGPLEALQFKYVDKSCFNRPKDLFFLVGGFYPARWENDHEVVIVRDVSTSGKVHECRVKVKRSAIPDTAEYRRLTALGPEKMAKIYAATSVTSPPARPVPLKVQVGTRLCPGPPFYDPRSELVPCSRTVH